LAQPKQREDPRISQRSKERIKRKLKRERKNLKAQAARNGRKMYPNMSSNGKTYGNVDQWTKAYQKATGASSGSTKNPEHFYQNKRTGKIKHKMTKSAMLRMQAAEKRKQ
jgi:hypothetical protein